MGLFDGTTFERPIRCEGCGEPTASCRCTVEDRLRLAAKAHVLRLQAERRGGGKWVTVIRGLEAEDGPRATLLAKLKSECGAGGTSKDGLIEIQGDQLVRLRTFLPTLGFKVRG